MNQDVHIVAVAARTPLGLTADSTVAAVRAGISQITEHPFLIDRKAEPVRLVMDSQLDPGMMGPSRLMEMGAAVLDEIAGKLAPYRVKLSNIPLFLGFPELRPGWTAESMRAVTNGVAGRPRSVPFHPVAIFPHGHTAGLMALDSACAFLRSGQAELAVVAGVDSYLSLETLEWLDRNRQLATSYHRGAFFPGEGASAFVVASDFAVQTYQLDSLAIVRAIGTATESKRIKTDAVCLGEGLTECIRKAAMPLQLPKEQIEGIICDINGERYRSEEWGFAMLRLPETFVDPTDYDIPASCWGDMGAASGALFVTLAVTAGKRGWAKGTRYMIWNSSEGGQRVAALLQLATQSREVMQ